MVGHVDGEPAASLSASIKQHPALWVGDERQRIAARCTGDVDAVTVLAVSQVSVDSHAR